MDSLLSNRLLIIPLIAWFTSQVFKVVIGFAIEKRLDLSIVIYPGGMPSSHAAIVTSLAVAVGKIGGFDSPLFSVAAVIAAVVMYDAAGVRRAVGIQAGVLNRLLDEYFKTHNFSEKRLRELVGHTPLQVFAGAAWGFIVAWLGA
ncbi:MAG: divergent PAP2 family protein [Dehalococcoidia bacterium]|nr:divergent PAP2 family protein [Dehalococcoidia bacterium]